MTVRHRTLTVGQRLEKQAMQRQWSNPPEQDDRTQLELATHDDMAIAQLHHLAMQLSSYIRSNRHAIIDYGARSRAGCRVATTLGESAVNSLVAKRMVKKQQMRWSQRGAHIMLQVRAATINGDLRARLREQPQAFASSFSWIFNPIRPLLQTA